MNFFLRNDVTQQNGQNFEFHRQEQNLGQFRGCGKKKWKKNSWAQKHGKKVNYINKAFVGYFFISWQIMVNFE